MDVCVCVCVVGNFHELKHCTSFRMVWSNSLDSLYNGFYRTASYSEIMHKKLCISKSFLQLLHWLNCLSYRNPSHIFHTHILAQLFFGIFMFVWAECGRFVFRYNHESFKHVKPLLLRIPGNSRVVEPIRDGRIFPIRRRKPQFCWMHTIFKANRTPHFIWSDYTWYGKPANVNGVRVRWSLVPFIA